MGQKGKRNIYLFRYLSLHRLISKLTYRVERLVNGLIGGVKMIFFRLRWLFLSPGKRYAYLWARTRKLANFGSMIWNVAISTNK